MDVLGISVTRCISTVRGTSSSSESTSVDVSLWPPALSAASVRLQTEQCEGNRRPNVAPEKDNNHLCCGNCSDNTNGSSVNVFTCQTVF